jgi:hypothetical protein
MKIKKNKKPYSYITYTSGDSQYNIDQFNKHFDGSVKCLCQQENNTETEDNQITDTVLTEAKHYVRRYYTRPQNRFASNKAELISILLQADDDKQNCTIYTLNNLGDEKDVTKLTNNDIIYTYDNGILKDKNGIKIMDYELKIKNEENRDKIDINTISNQTFSNIYDDRITGLTGIKDIVKESLDSNEYNLDFDNINAYGENLTEEEKKQICCICGETFIGCGNNPYPYKETGRCCDSCNIHFVIPARIEAVRDKNNK